MRRHMLYSIVALLMIVSEFAIAAEFKGLGDLPGGSIDSNAWDISGDGSTVVGQSRSGRGPEAFIWTDKEGIKGIGDLAGGLYASLARSVSADGSVVVGDSSSDRGQQAFRWTAKTGMKGLGDLPGRDFYSYATGVSADGSVIVGYCELKEGKVAFVWDRLKKMRDLNVVLSDSGVNLKGWILAEATGISDDGTIIVGNGINPTGNTEAWIAHVSEQDPNDHTSTERIKPDQVETTTPDLPKEKLSLEENFRRKLRL